MRNLVLLALLLSPPALAQEALVTLRSTVTGNREQPRVMYIVPWRQPGTVEFEFGMENSIADDLFVPLDREEFVRGLAYQAMIESASEGDAGTD